MFAWLFIAQYRLGDLFVFRGVKAKVETDTTTKLRPFIMPTDLSFSNTRETGLSLAQVHDRVVSFMQLSPYSNYTFMVGTDSQVHYSHTVFITGVIIHCQGKGAWACKRQVVVPREIHSIKEKLSLETSYSEQVAIYFTGQNRSSLEDVILPFIYQGASIDFIIDIDAGSDDRLNKTAPFVNDQILRVESLGMTARIKPDSIAASSYADRYTKYPSTKVSVV